jgi:hypothetical protein
MVRDGSGLKSGLAPLLRKRENAMSMKNNPVLFIGIEDSFFGLAGDRFPTALILGSSEAFFKRAELLVTAK